MTSPYSAIELLADVSVCCFMQFAVGSNKSLEKVFTMSRKPEYSMKKVFEQAIPLVLKKGYRGCSMQQLISHTGFNRRAFYLEFANKQAFFDALVAYYIDEYLRPLQDILRSEQEIPEAIMQYFFSYQQHIDQQGCLLVRIIVEIGKEDDTIQHLARQYYDELQLCFIACLERAISHQQLNNNIDVESFALKLSCFAQGFAVSNNIQQGQSDALIVIQSLFDQQT